MLAKRIKKPYRTCYLDEAKKTQEETEETTGWKEERKGERKRVGNTVGKISNLEMLGAGRKMKSRARRSKIS